MILILLESKFKTNKEIIIGVKTLFYYLGFPFKIVFDTNKITDSSTIISYGNQTSFLKKVKKKKILIIPESESKKIPKLLQIKKVNNQTYLLNFDIINLATEILVKNKFSAVKGYLDKDGDEKASNLFLMGGLKQISDFIVNDHLSKRKLLVQKCYWPENRDFCGCLTHDVDVPFKYNFIGTLIELKKSAVFLLKFDVKRSIKVFLGIVKYLFSFKDPYFQFQRLMEVEQKYGYRSTFYFFSRRIHKLDPYYNVNKLSKIMEEMIKKGFEVGLHGSYTSYKSSEKLILEKKIIENINNSKVAGIRQHFLNFKLPETWISQGVAGFSYDTTLGYRDDIGSKNGFYYPITVYLGENKKELIELPMILMDAAVMESKLLGNWDQVRSFCDKVIKCNGLITLNWHQRVFFKDDFPGWSNMYLNLLDYFKARGGYVAPATEIEEWFKQRQGIEFKEVKSNLRNYEFSIVSGNDIKEMWFTLYTKNKKIEINTNLKYQIQRKNKGYVVKFIDIKKNKNYKVRIK